MTEDTDTHETESTNTRQRLDRLETLVEEQRETIEDQRDRIDELETEDPAREPETGEETTTGSVSAPDSGSSVVTRRNALKAGGLLALLGMGAGTASADPQGQVGTGSDPLQALYTEELNGGVTGDQAVTDLLGNGLALDTGSLGIAAGGVGSNELATDSVTNAEIAASAVDTNELATDAVTNAEIAASAVDTNELATDAVTSTEIATDSVTGSEIDLASIAGNNITVDGANDELDAAQNWEDADANDLLEPSGTAMGIEVSEAKADSLVDNGSGMITLQTLIDLNGSDIRDGGAIIWDSTAGYIPQPRLQNDSLTVTAGNGLVGGGFVSLGGSTTLGIDTGGVTSTEIASGAVGRTQLALDPVENPGTSTGLSPGFDTWTTVDAGRPAWVEIAVDVFTDGTTTGTVEVQVDESGGTTVDYSFAADATAGLGAGEHVTEYFNVYVPAGGQFQIQNLSDPNGGNSIQNVRAIVG